jgi:non-heme chloroperoxidase
MSRSRKLAHSRLPFHHAAATKEKDGKPVERMLTDDGEEIPLLAEGDGPSVVLLHEWTSNHFIWEPIARRLKASFRVIRWDARGHGAHRRKSSDPITISRMADDLACLLRRFERDKPTVVGHSMGAVILWDYIRLHGCDSLGRVAFIDMTPRTITDDDWRLGIFEDWPEARNQSFVEAMETDFVEAMVSLAAWGQQYKNGGRGENGAGNFERLRKLLATLEPAPLIEIWRSIMAGDWRPVLPTIDIPTLLIYGAKSNFYAVDTGHHVADAIPNSVLHLYEGADHYPHIAEPDRFVDDLGAFIGPSDSATRR